MHYSHFWSLNLSETSTLCSPPQTCLTLCTTHQTSWAHICCRTGLQQDKYESKKGEKLFQKERKHKLRPPFPSHNGLLNHQKANFCHQLKLRIQVITKLTRRFQCITRFLCLAGIWHSQAKEKFHTYQVKRGYFAPHIHILGRKALPQHWPRQAPDKSSVPSFHLSQGL